MIKAAMSIVVGVGMVPREHWLMMNIHGSMLSVSVVDEDLCLKLSIIVFHSISHLVFRVLWLQDILSLIFMVFYDHLLLRTIMYCLVSLLVF